MSLSKRDMVLGSIYWYANSALLHMLHLDTENNAKEVIDTIFDNFGPSRAKR